MKKNIFLGVDDEGRCCVLKSLADFNQLCINTNNISSDDFVYYSTNWSGWDEIQRTLKIEGLTLTRRILKLPKKLFFHGQDYDHGHTSDWVFSISYIYETWSENE